MNSAANTDTLADIAKKCRDEEIALNMASITSAKAMGAILNDLADRIEAAAERERKRQEALRINECIVSREEEASEWQKRIGNVAAMREALEGVVKYLGEIIPTQREIELVKSARAALSAPARNCDRFATYKEAVEAYRAWAKRTTGNVSNVSGRGMLGWIFDTAEGKEESNG